MTPFSVELEGPARVVALGNGNPIDLDSYADLTHSLFYGSATLILRSSQEWNNSEEDVRLTLKVEGMDDVILTIGK